MPHKLISDLKEGDPVQQYFLVRQTDSGKTKDGSPFLSLDLGDKSGSIKAKVWSDVLAKCPGPFTSGDQVAVQGKVDSFKGELQLNVRYINTVEALRDLGRDLQVSPFDFRMVAPVKRRRALLASNPLRNSRSEADRNSGGGPGSPPS